MQCGIAILSEDLNSSLVAEAVYGNDSVFYPHLYTMDEALPALTCDGGKWFGYDCYAKINCPFNYSLIDNYIDPSISKLKNFNLSRVISVDINLVENSKFEIVSLDKRKSKPMGVIIYNEEK